MRGTVLLFGGSSDERLVSVASAQNLARVGGFDELLFAYPEGPVALVPPSELLRHANAFTTPFAPAAPTIARTLEAALPRLRGKTVFIGMHGTEGEDGHIQSMFDGAGVFYTGSGAKASSDCFNKARAKEIAGRAGLRLARGARLENQREAAEIARNLRLFLEDLVKRGESGTFVAKPVESGSSFGLHVLTAPSQIETVAAAIASSPYDEFLMEEFITGRELTVGVLETSDTLRPLPPSEVKIEEGRDFDYEGKYLGRGTLEITPARLTESEREQAQEMSLAAHRAFGCYGYTRTDMILTPTGPVFLETNTLPGLTKASFIPQQLEAAGIPMSAFIESQILSARARGSTLSTPSASTKEAR